MNTGRIVVIGDQDAVLGLSFLGFAGQIVSDAQAALRALEEALADPEIDLILVTEHWAEAWRERLDQAIASESGPLIIEIPGNTAIEGVPPPTHEDDLLERIERLLGFTVENQHA